MPVRDKSGKTVGVYGADISLDWLYDQLSQSDLEDNLIGKSYVGIFDRTSYSFNTNGLPAVILDLLREDTLYY